MDKDIAALHPAAQVVKIIFDHLAAWKPERIRKCVMHFICLFVACIAPTIGLIPMDKIYSPESPFLALIAAFLLGIEGISAARDTYAAKYGGTNGKGS